MDYNIFTKRQIEKIEKAPTLLSKDSEIAMQLLDMYQFWQKRLSANAHETKEKQRHENLNFFLRVCREYIQFMKDRDLGGHSKDPSPENNKNGLEWRISLLKKEIHDVMAFNKKHYDKFARLYPDILTDGQEIISPAQKERHLKTAPSTS